MKNKDKDILLLCQYFHPEYVSSAQLPFNIATDFAKEGFKVSVLTGFPKEYTSTKEVKKSEIVNHINIKRLRYIQLNRSNFIGRLINYFSFTVTVLLNFRKIKDYKSIMIFSNPPILPIIGVLAKKIFKTKFIFVSYDVYPEIAIRTKVLKKDSIINRIMKLINKSVFENVDKVITLSEEMSSTLKANRKNLKNNELVTIPNWDTSEEESKQEITISKFNYLKNKTVIAYFGNIGIAQDEKVLFRTLKSIKNDNNFHFIFAGHGNKIDELKKFVKENEIENIDIFSFLQGSDFEEALSITDFSIVSLQEGLHGLAVPSKTYTLLRAGIPVLAAMDEDSDIVQALRKYNSGFHIEKNNHDEIINRLKSMSLQEISQLKINSLKLYHEEYQRKLGTSKYIKVLNELIKE